MRAQKTIAARCSVATLVFFIILGSMVFVHPIFGTLLGNEPCSFSNTLFVTSGITAFLATVTILSLFLATIHYEKKSIHNDFAEKKDDWEKTFNTMTDFVSVHDHAYRITKVNNALCDFLNRRPEEIMGKFCYQVYHGLDVPFDNCPHKKSSEIKEPVTEVIIDPRIGVPLQITCSPFLSEAGEFQGSIHIARVMERAINRKKMSGEMVPICAACKNIRIDHGNWLPPEAYFMKNSNLQFTHTICRSCSEKLYPNLAD